MEKVCALKEQRPEAFLHMSKEKHIDVFTAFSAQLIASFERYVSGEDVDLQRDRAGYHVVELHVTDEEFRGLAGKTGALIMEAVQNELALDRKVKQLATIIIPEGNGHD